MCVLQSLIILDFLLDPVWPLVLFITVLLAWEVLLDCDQNQVTLETHSDLLQDDDARNRNRE